MINCQKIKFEDHTDGRGSLIAIENPKNFPFPIKRVYYIYNVKEGVERGFHSHKDLEQVLIPLGGSIKVRTKTDKEEQICTLEDPSEGLFIGPMIWREMFDFSPNSTLLVLASHEYDSSDYIRDEKEYLKLAKVYFEKLSKINDFCKGKDFYLKPVEDTDAEFLYSLRSNSELCRYISPISGTVEEQKNWIRNYKIREFRNQEYYFKVVNKNNEDQGFVRLYHLDNDKKEVTFGSFLMKPGHDSKAAIEAMILAVNVAFYYLKVNKVLLDVRVKNERAKNFYNRFGYQKIDENELDEFYELTKEDYDKLYEEKYKKMIMRK